VRTIAVAACILVATGCGGANQPPNAARASVMETLSIGVSSGSVTPFLSAIEQEPIFAGDAVGFQAMPGYPQRLRAQVATESYTAAFDDARAKATAIAAHLGARLGSPRSIDEVARGYDGSYAPASGVNMGQSVTMAAPPRSVSDAAVRRIGAKFGVDAGHITVQNANINTY
jgi:hypothetical protein